VTLGQEKFNDDADVAIKGEPLREQALKQFYGDGTRPIALLDRTPLIALEGRGRLPPQM
jgi:hypothetical protein